MQITREKILRMVGTTMGGSTRMSGSGGSGGGGDAQYAAEAGHALTADTAAEATHAASADTATTAGNLATDSTDWEKIMRKDIAQTAAEVITFAKGLVSTLRSYFRSGITVTGSTVTESLRVTGDADVEGDLHAFGDVEIDGSLGAGSTSVSELEVANGVDIGGVLKAGKTQALQALIDYLKSKNITTENLTVTGAAHFFKLVIDELKSQQGAVIITAANCEAAQVTPMSDITPGATGYVVYFRASDADGNEITNSWLVGDQALCQTFNAAEGTSYNVSNQFYWRLVEAVSSSPVTLDDGNQYHYIVLSDTTMAAGSMVPKAGDHIMQLGYRGTDSSVLPGRRSAIILSAYQCPDTELVPPLFAKYVGINDFSLATHRETFFEASRNRVVGEFRVESGGRTISLSNAVAEEMMGGAANWLQATDFATAADVAENWTKTASHGSAATSIAISTERKDGQNTMAFDLGAYTTAADNLLRLRQVAKVVADGSPVLCLSAYFRAASVNTAGTAVFGLEVFGGTISEVYYTGSTLTTYKSNGSSRSYAQITVGDTEWHRMWVLFTPNSYTAVDMGIFAWRNAAATATAPVIYMAMPKLEIGSEPTQWTPTADALRRAGIDIVGGDVMIYGDHINLEGTVTANKGFGINIDGSMYANNGTFAGIVRTKMQAVTPANAADKLSNQTDFVRVEDDYTTGTYGYLIPQQCPAGVQTDILKTGAAVLFDRDGGAFSAGVQIHLPFVYPYDEPGNTKTFEVAFKEAYNDDTAYWAEVLRARSFVGAVVEIVNQMGSGITIPLCGIKESGSSTFPDSPWKIFHLPYGGAVRLECVRETSGGSSTAFLDNVYWKVVGYTTGISIPIAAVE